MSSELTTKYMYRGGLSMPIFSCLSLIAVINIFKESGNISMLMYYLLLLLISNPVVIVVEFCFTKATQHSGKPLCQWQYKCKTNGLNHKSTKKIPLQWIHMNVRVSQINGNSTVCSTARSGWQQRKYQSSVSLSHCEVNSSVTRGLPS